MRVRKILLRTLLVFVLLAGGVGLAAYRSLGTFDVEIPDSLKGKEPGALVAVQRIGKYPGFVMQYFLDSVELPDPIELKNGITVYNVQYQTTNYDGSVVVASGLVALPNGSDLHSTIGFFHGTNAERSTAPSQPGLREGLLVAGTVAGTGHVFLAPDYLGLGESQTTHPYMHTKMTVSTCVDFLNATQSLVEHLRGTWPASLYLMGFSQGGHATLALQRSLEEMADPRFQVKASAPIAGPFYLREVSIPQALTGETESHAFYLAYIANSYSCIYQQPLESILTSPYVKNVPILFDGDHTSSQIFRGLPNDPRDLFNPEFLEAYDNDKPHWFLDALVENSIGSWTPAAPIRIYYGDNDVDVLPEEARRTETAMKQRGANITAISVGPHDHETSALYALPKAIRWFSELANKKPAG